MAKYECKVCGYIYNDQHASRSFEELSECPICNEGKENFVALDADNNPVEEVKAKVDSFEEVKEEAKAEDVFATEAKEEEAVAPASDFVVERRQDFWTPVSANAEKKEEPVAHNTTGWTIDNAMSSVSKVIGSEEEKEEVKESAADAEEEDIPAFNSRIESFYSSAEPVSASHIISGDEEEEQSFKPLWNAGGGTVQRVIDPFNDKNDSVVKAENVGMVMPAEAPVVEEILGEEELVEEIEEVAEAVEEAEVAKAVEEETAEDVQEENVEETVAVEEETEAQAEDTVEEIKEAEEESFVEESKDEELFADERQDAVAEFDDFAQDEDDDFFTEMTMDAVMGVTEDAHEHGDVSISEAEVFEAIDAIVFDDDVPEGGRVEVVSADGTETIELSDEDEKEDGLYTEEETESFFFDDEEEEEVAAEEKVEEATEETIEEVVEETVEEVVAEASDVEETIAESETTEEAADDFDEDEEPFVFEEFEEAVSNDSEEDTETAAFDFSDIDEADIVTEEEAETNAVEAEDAFLKMLNERNKDVMEEKAAEETEGFAAEPQNLDEEAEESTAEEAPVVKGWSFLDDVVEAGVATGAAVAGVNFVSKAMDEVVDEEVTDEDIEEVFVDFAEETKEDAKEHEFKAALAEELFAQEPVTFKEDIPFAEQCDSIEEEKKEYCNNLEKILIVPAQLNPMPLPEGTEVEGRTVLGITSERPLVLDNPVFSTGDYNMVQYIPNSGLTSEDYQQADAIEIIVGHGNGIEKTINSKEDLRQVVNFLRLESDGCPIGIKMAASRIERDLEFCVFAKPDYVVLNNFDVVPLPYALHRATKFLNTVQSSMDIVIALDGAKDAEELAKIMAMGADVIALRNRPEDMIKMTEGLKKYARITGHYDVEDLNVKDLCTVDREIAEYTDIYHV